MLSDAEISHYHREGYVIPGLRLPPARLASLRATLDRLIAGIRAFGPSVSSARISKARMPKASKAAPISWIWRAIPRSSTRYRS